MLSLWRMNEHGKVVQRPYEQEIRDILFNIDPR